MRKPQFVNYCSHCGYQPLVFEIPLGDSRPRFVCPNCKTIHYQNPKVVVGCLPIWQDQILLCKRSIEPRAGFWNLPAGYLENGETVQMGAKRETWEEAGSEVQIVRLHAVFDLPEINQVYLFFLAKMTSSHFESGIETLETKLFLPQDIPFEDMAFVSSTFAIRRYLEDPDGSQVYFGQYPNNSTKGT